MKCKSGDGCRDKATHGRAEWGPWFCELHWIQLERVIKASQPTGTYQIIGTAGAGAKRPE